MKNQFETDKFMSSWSKAYRQIWSLYQQFGSEEVYFRVVGLRQQEPTQFIKGGQDEEYDFVLNYQIEAMDTEKTFEKIKQIAQIVATADREGVVDYSEWLQAMIEAIDPTISERIIQPKDVGQQKVMADLQDKLAKVYAAADLFVFPSVTETYGNVTPEALASGLAVLACGYAAAAELIRHDDNGLLVPRGDDAAFIEQAVRLVRSPALVQALRQRARADTLSRGWEQVATRVEGIWQDLVARHAASHPA